MYPVKMIAMPWLMFFLLSLISTFQWPNSIAQHIFILRNHTEWKGYLLSSTENGSKETNLVNQDNITTTTTSSYKRDQKNDSVADIGNIKVIVLSAVNLTNSSSFVFPNSMDETIAINKFIPELKAIEKCSLNDTFCIKVDNYPREDLSNLFRKSKFMENPYYDIDAINEINDFETRMSDDRQLEPFCQARVSVIYPEVGLTSNNQWRYIVQDQSTDNSSIKQGIVVEKCDDIRVPCMFDDTLPTGYVSTCIQKYFYKRLITVSGSNEFYYDTFKMPSCCQCKYRIDEDQLTRKGGD